MPPNTTNDYHYHKPTKTPSDIEDWRAHGLGNKTLVSSARWVARYTPAPVVVGLYRCGEPDAPDGSVRNPPGRPMVAGP